MKDLINHRVLRVSAGRSFHDAGTRPFQLRWVGFVLPSSLLRALVTSSVSLAAAAYLLAHAAHAADRVPPESNTSLFYSLTHLPLTAYVILFAVFIVSVANLFYQGILSVRHGHFAWVHRLWKRSRARIRREKRENPPDSTGTRSTPWKQPTAQTDHAVGEAELEEGIQGPVRAVSKPRTVEPVMRRRAASTDARPSPLEGVNHPLPRMVMKQPRETGSPRLVGKVSDKGLPSREFKFTSAVNVPSKEELRRREREQLIVSGHVIGADDSPLTDVLVYLTDRTGNRLGQSCRSQAETGEFKVLVTEAGPYFLNAYRRGYVIEDRRPVALPIESGKIEGLEIRMVEDGCVIRGRVVVAENGYGEELSSLNVQLVCGAEAVGNRVPVDSAGNFTIPTAPWEQECVVHVLSQGDATVCASQPFHTGRNQELYQEMHLPSLEPDRKDADREELTEDVGQASGDHTPETGERETNSSRSVDQG